MLNWKRAIASGIILEAVMFLLGSAYMFVLGLSGDAFGIAMVVSVAVVITLLSRLYYFKKMDKNYMKPINGAMFGLVVVVVSALIEIPLMVYGFQKAVGWAYFLNRDLLTGYLLVIVIPTLIAWMKK